MSYKPKFKQKELYSIAKKFESSDVLPKVTQEPVKIEFYPYRQLAKVYWSLNADGSNSFLGKDATYYTCHPIEVYEIGYKAWLEKYYIGG